MPVTILYFKSSFGLMASHSATIASISNLVQNCWTDSDANCEQVRNLKIRKAFGNFASKYCSIASK